jgi:hypothetical protein
VEGGSGRSEASPTAILQDTHSVEVEFCELRLYRILGSSSIYSRNVAHMRDACPSRREYAVIVTWSTDSRVRVHPAVADGIIKA